MYIHVCDYKCTHTLYNALIQKTKLVQATHMKLNKGCLAIPVMQYSV